MNVFVWKIFEFLISFRHILLNTEYNVLNPLLSAVTIKNYVRIAFFSFFFLNHLNFIYTNSHTKNQFKILFIGWNIWSWSWIWVQCTRSAVPVLSRLVLHKKIFWDAFFLRDFLSFDQLGPVNSKERIPPPRITLLWTPAASDVGRSHGEMPFNGVLFFHRNKTIKTLNLNSYIIQKPLDYWFI